MVKEIVQANSLFSSAGIGPVSKNSLPFYAGRYIDKASGRIRVLPNPTSKYINPLSYNARLSYLQARIINNWNKYVAAEDKYLDLLSYSEEDWEKKQKVGLKKALMGSEKNR